MHCKRIKKSSADIKRNAAVSFIHASGSCAYRTGDVNDRMKTAILTDTHSGILQKEATENGIFLLPTPFIVNGVQHAVGVDFSSEDFYRELNAGAEVSTSQPSPGDILKLWDEILQSYDEIVCIPLSSGLSGGYQTMVMLAEEAPYQGRVFPVDNTSVSVTQQRAVYNAKALAARGYTAVQIKEILERHRKNNLIFITVTTLKYLKKGGRITPAAAALGSLLGIKPVLEIDGAKLDAFTKVRTMAKAREVMLNAAQQTLDTRLQDPEAAHSYIMVADAENEEGADELMAAARARWPKAEFHRAPLALAIACHVGPGALGLVAERKLPELEAEPEEMH